MNNGQICPSTVENFGPMMCRETYANTVNR